MRAKRLYGAATAAGLAVGLWASAAGAVSPQSHPLTKAECKDGGWRTFGSLFANQGECVSAAEHDAIITFSGGTYGLNGSNHNETVLSIA